MPSQYTQLLVVYLICTVIFALAVIFGWRLVHKFITRRYLYAKFKNLYFCGYTVAEIVDRDLFNKLERYLGVDLCDVTSSLLMLALRGNETSRLVYEQPQSKHFSRYHSWVEFYYLGQWYIIESSLLECSIMTKREFGKVDISDAIVFSYEEFWNNPASAQFYDRMTKAETSNLFSELYSFANCVGETISLDADSGLNFYQFWLVPTRPLTPEIFKNFMSNREYREPSHQDILDAFTTDRTFHAVIPTIPHRKD